MANEEDCSLDEYIGGDDDLGFCFDMENENWEDEFLRSVVRPEDMEVNGLEQEESGAEENDVLPPEPKIKCIQQAIDSLEDVQHFLQYHGHVDDVSKLSSMIDQLVGIQSRKLVQQSIDCFLKV